MARVQELDAPDRSVGETLRTERLAMAEPLPILGIETELRGCRGLRHEAGGVAGTKLVILMATCGAACLTNV